MTQELLRIKAGNVFGTITGSYEALLNDRLIISPDITVFEYRIMRTNTQHYLKRTISK